MELQPRLERIRELLRKIDWQHATPKQRAAALRAAREFRMVDRGLVEEVRVQLGLSPDDISIYATMSEEQLEDSIAWSMLERIGNNDRAGKRARNWANFPHEGLIGDYLEFTLTSEAPLSFHFWCAVSAISASCPRNRYLERGLERIYPSIPLVLVSESGTRKSSATNIARGLLSEAGDIGKIIVGKSTPEAIIHSLKGDPKVFSERPASAFIYAEELAHFLGRQKYNEGLTALLTHLFDCPERTNSLTLAHGDVELRRVYLTLLGGTTLTALRKSIPASAHEDGFMSRILWVHQETGERDIPRPPRPCPFLRERILRHLRDLAACPSAPLELSGAACALYDRWYLKHKEASRNAVDARSSGYWGRKPTWIWKLGMILALSEDPHAEIVHAEHLRRAMRLMELIERPMLRIFEAVESSPWVYEHTEALRRMFTTRYRRGEFWVHRSDIARQMARKLKARQLEDLLGLLKQGKMLEERREKRPGQKPARLFRAAPEFLEGS